MGLKPREAVKNLPVYTPARNLDVTKREYGLEKVIKLAGNENTLGFSPLAREALENITSYYPDGGVVNLREKTAAKFGVKPEQVIFGNGSFELLFLVGLAFLEKGDEAILAEPSFGWYKNVTLIQGATIVPVPLEEYKVNLEQIAAAITDRTKVIWLCNPNNPTGTIFTEEGLNLFLSKIRDDIVVVLDEAYYDFVNESGYPQTIPLIEKYDNIIVLRTFSKLEGLANFRIGYGFAGEELIGYLNQVRLPINVTGPAQLAAYAALDDDDFKQKTLANVRQGLATYYERFNKWGISYVKSNTNFILADVGVETEPLVEEFLKNGIMLRGGKEFGYPTAFRISIGTPEENEEVLSLLGKTLGKE